jgi:hypothetical protein
MTSARSASARLAPLVPALLLSATPLLAPLFALLPLGGCASSHVPEVGSGTYAGPAITTDSSGPTHTLVLTAPTGGWAFALDQVRKEFDHERVFVTVTRPDPAYMQTQALVRHEVGTAVPSDRPIQVFARTTQAGGEAGPYLRLP